MKTIVLPGYSLHNKEWALEIKKRLSYKQAVLVHEWTHWRLGGTLRPKHEIELILKEIGWDKVNIIAKSVGTMVAMLILPQIAGKVGKIILCGIPSISAERLNLFQKALKDFRFENVICFQNSKDPFATYIEVKNFLAGISPKIEVVETPRNDHNYPYFEKFQQFLF